MKKVLLGIGLMSLLAGSPVMAQNAVMDTAKGVVTTAVNMTTKVVMVPINVTKDLVNSVVTNIKSLF